MEADEERLQQVKDVGPVVALSIRQFFSERHNREIIGELMILKLRDEIQSAQGP